ncbi:unnamed protein product [Angiostrongylus costaricensis]|uniref:Kringle domain-containing protein n=1 Tax=Angiostrongylus costaricensis TaxID=334426 RepID=A0A0R3PRC7_ANGCS|nr:unnamed protein product [Angiostrongylus costaricensis]
MQTVKGSNDMVSWMAVTYVQVNLDYITQKVFSTTISQHENYCRNPDNHPLGPWCFYEDEDKIRRAPCFYTCATDIRRLCLAKAFFPYYQTPYPFDNAPLSPVDPRVLRTIKDSGLRKRNAQLGQIPCLDLSDILDVPDVVGAVEHATPLYSIALTTRHLTQARLAGNAVVTRKKCHQTGMRTLIAGPWTSIKDDSLFLPEDSDPEHVGPILRDFLRSQMLAGRQGIDKPWRPCFSACEDNTYTAERRGERHRAAFKPGGGSLVKGTKLCWPISTENQLNSRLFYFGNKVVDRRQRSCLKWTEAMSVLYRHYSSYIKEVKKKSAVKRKELKTFVKFGPCFDPCKCKSETMHEPFQSYREMCEKENHDYEPCTASRDARALNIRYYDEKLKAIPEAHIPGIFTPLITTVLSGTMSKGEDVNISFMVHPFGLDYQGDLGFLKNAADITILMY